MTEHQPPPCGKCSVCNNNIKMWPALCKPGVWLVVLDVFVSGTMICGNHTMDNVSAAIQQYPTASKHLFSSHSNCVPQLGTVHKLLFILIAADIITLKYIKDTEKEKSYIWLDLAKVSNLDAQCCLMIDSYWMNIQLKNPIIAYT